MTSVEQAFGRTHLQSLKMTSVIEIIYASTESFVITNIRG